MDRGLSLEFNILSIRPFSILPLNRVHRCPTIDDSSASAVAAGVRVSRGGPGQWGYVNLVRAGTQQP
jgi:hypothetical protein